MIQNVIAPNAPEDGNDWEPQCARCGSTYDFDLCESCGGDGVYGHDCGEDACCCLDPEDNQPCEDCGGEGTFGTCISSPEWCQAHPLPGREDVPAGTVEWFCIKETSRP